MRSVAAATHAGRAQDTTGWILLILDSKFNGRSVQKTLGVVGKTEAKFYKPRPEAEVCRIAEVFSLSTEGRSPRYLGDPPTPNGF